MKQLLERLFFRTILGLIGLMLLSTSSLAQNAPNPTSLLQGVESIRLQIPPSSLKIKMFFRDSLVTNETTLSVDFDNDLRGFNCIAQTADEGIYKTVFDGEQVICYDESLGQVTYRNLNNQNQMALFDPRLIGISTYNTWADSLSDVLPYRGTNSQVQLIGMEEVGNLPAWHVRLINTLPFGKSIKDYWIDDKNGFRVYRKDWNGVQTYSYYENDSYPGLPSRVITKEYHGSDNNRTLVAEREIDIVEARGNVNLSKDRWTLAGMSIKPKTQVVDFNLQRVIGAWNGKRIAPIVPDFTVNIKEHSGIWARVICLLFLIMPPVVFWILKRRNDRHGGS